MNSNIYQLALECRHISEESIKIVRTHIPGRGVLYTDYTVKGGIEDYLNAIDALLPTLTEKYPDMGYELRLHKDLYKNDKIIHFTGMKTIVNCVIALEKYHSKKIFISHSSKDTKVVKLFVDRVIQLGVGLRENDVFCTSIEEMGIKNGEDIRNHIRSNVQSADFSFLMISKNYKKSEICLNEMGAVWATDNHVRYYLLPDVDFDEIGWLCDAKQVEKLGDPVALDTLVEELTKYYGLPHSGSAWSRQRQDFLDYLGEVSD